ncbi:hypothetical protein [Halomarina pelagica]|nr:hypothetical protein [Halomarina sp. BND7]
MDGTNVDGVTARIVVAGSFLPIAVGLASVVSVLLAVVAATADPSRLRR